MVFRKIGHFIGNAVSTVGKFGLNALGKIGVLKSSYDNINNSLGGLIGRAIESVHGVGPVLGSVGKFLNSQESLKVLTNTFKRADIYSSDIKRVAESLQRLKGS